MLKVKYLKLNLPHHYLLQAVVVTLVLLVEVVMEQLFILSNSMKQLQQQIVKVLTWQHLQLLEVVDIEKR